MNKKDEKFGFARRDAYDLSQPSLSPVSKNETGTGRESRTAAKASSYTSEPPSKAVVKRIKMR